MNSNRKNKVIFLDWNGTLSDSFFWEHMRISDDSEVLALYNLWDIALFNKPKKYIEDWMRGRFSTEKVLKEIASKTSTEYEKLLREFVKGCESMEFVSDEIPSLVEVLKGDGYCVVIATNNMDCFTRWTVPFMQLDKLFDEVLNSYNLKGLKHDIKKGESLFFKKFFEKYDFKPQECIFLDDSVDKGGYIASLGIEYVQIKNSKDLLKRLKSL
ncbi:MAG: HAD family hydrolase [Candidatus Dojkabacteria bacterium]